MSTEPGKRLRYAVVGTGARAEMFVRALVLDHPATAKLVAFADVNQARMDAHNEWLEELGFDSVPTYLAVDYTTMLEKERVDVVLVTTVDRVHDEYIVAALRSGRDVITEKPMTIDVPRCQRILDTVAETGRKVSVAFNYRYNPLHEKVREVLAAGEIGEIGSVHFEWLLDVRHGADYFRRWHREKANSGGLMVHKASHHFDLVNWWLDAVPEEVYASGRLFFYGETGRRHGYARDYERAHGSRPPPATRSPCTWPATPAAGALPGRRGRGRLPPRPERLRARRHHRGRHVGAGEVLQRRDHDLPPDRVRALGGLPGDGQREQGAAGTGGRGERLRQPVRGR